MESKFVSACGRLFYFSMSACRSLSFKWMSTPVGLVQFSVQLCQFCSFIVVHFHTLTKASPRKKEKEQQTMFCQFPLQSCYYWDFLFNHSLLELKPWLCLCLLSHILDEIPLDVETNNHLLTMEESTAADRFLQLIKKKTDSRHEISSKPSADANFGYLKFPRR